MTFKMSLITLISLSLCFAPTLACTRIPKNVSCKDIQVDKGFKFLYECPEEGQIFVTKNETNLAIYTKGNVDHSDEAINMTNAFVIMRTCSNITVKCTYDVNFTANYRCLDFITDGDTMTQGEDSDPGKSSLTPLEILGVLAGVSLILLAGGFCFWRKKKFKKCLLTQVRRLFKPKEARPEHPRSDDGRAVQEVPAGGSGVQQSPESRNGHPHGSGGKEAEQDETLSSVLVQSGNMTAPNSIGTSGHRATNGRANNGWTAHDAEDASQPLLRDSRAAIQTGDGTGEAGAVVNEPGFDPNQPSGCSTAPESDVESTQNMENEKETEF